MRSRLAVLWMGPPGSLQAIGVWPAAEAINVPGRHLREVLRGGEPVGAVSVDCGPLSLAEARLLDDLTT